MVDSQSKGQFGSYTVVEKSHLPPTPTKRNGRDLVLQK